MTDVLPRKFTTRFGILVPNTNYPPGIDYRYRAWEVISMGDTDVGLVFVDSALC
jgi:hypothetical protein